jgi:hypothetical protein
MTVQYPAESDPCIIILHGKQRAAHSFKSQIIDNRKIWVCIKCGKIKEFYRDKA